MGYFKMKKNEKDLGETEVQGFLKAEGIKHQKKLFHAVQRIKSICRINQKLY